MYSFVKIDEEVPPCEFVVQRLDTFDLLQEAVDLEGIVAQRLYLARCVLDRLDDGIDLVSSVEGESEDAYDVGHGRCGRG